MEQKEQKILRKFSGVVVSSKTPKSIVVKVDNVKWHAKYRKQFVSSKNYLVHDENSQYKEGDKVEFVECRPLSRLKRWRVISKEK